MGPVWILVGECLSSPTKFLKTMWLWITERLLYINLAWYVLLAAGFCMAGNWGMVLYFVGAGILTLGIIVVNGM